MKAPVRSLATQVRGVAYTKGDARSEPAEGFVPLVRAGNITDRGLTFDDLVYVPESCVSARQILQPGDVVVAASSGSIDVVGKAASVLEPSSCAFGAFCKVLRPNDLVDHRYFGHYFRTAGYRRQVSALAAGANINNLRAGDFDGLEIRLPPLDEQQRIAAILDQADELRAKRRAAIAHLDSLTDAIFLDMFGDPALSQRFVALGDITASARLGLVRSSKQLSEGGPYPYIRMNAISADGRLDSSSLQRTFASRDELASSTLDRGDLLFNTRNSRDLVGKCAVFRGDERCLFNNNLLRLRFTDGIAPEFVWAVLNSTYGKRELMSRASGTTSVFAIYAKDLASVPIPLADPDRQALFSDAVAEVDSNRSQHTTSLSALDVLFASLQARAFAGDL